MESMQHGGGGGGARRVDSLQHKLNVLESELHLRKQAEIEQLQMKLSSLESKLQNQKGTTARHGLITASRAEPTYLAPSHLMQPQPRQHATPQISAEHGEVTGPLFRGAQAGRGRGGGDRGSPFGIGGIGGSARDQFDAGGLSGGYTFAPPSQFGPGMGMGSVTATAIPGATHARTQPATDNGYAPSRLTFPHGTGGAPACGGPQLVRHAQPQARPSEAASASASAFAASHSPAHRLPPAAAAAAVPAASSWSTQPPPPQPWHSAADARASDGWEQPEPQQPLAAQPAAGRAERGRGRGAQGGASSVVAGGRGRGGGRGGSCNSAREEGGGVGAGWQLAQGGSRVPPAPPAQPQPQTHGERVGSQRLGSAAAAQGAGALGSQAQHAAAAGPARGPMPQPAHKAAGPAQQRTPAPMPQPASSCYAARPQPLPAAVSLVAQAEAEAEGWLWAVPAATPTSHVLLSLGYTPSEVLELNASGWAEHDYGPFAAEVLRSLGVELSAPQIAWLHTLPVHERQSSSLSELLRNLRAQATPLCGRNLLLLVRQAGQRAPKLVGGLVDAIAQAWEDAGRSGCVCIALDGFEPCELFAQRRDGVRTVHRVYQLPIVSAGSR